MCRFDATPNIGGSGASFSDPILLDSTLVAFDASVSFDPDGAISSWDWDFGDGDIGTGEALTHDYFATTSPGDILPAILIVTDGSSNTCTLTKFVEVL